MKSAQSSAINKKFRPFGYLFSTNLTGLIWLGILNVIGCMAVSPTILLPQQISRLKEFGQESSWGFSLFDGEAFSIMLYLSIPVCFSILIAVWSFREFSSKKKANVFFSLGVSREKLFFSKYLSGLLTAWLSTVLSLLTAFLINVWVLGASVQLWQAALYFFCGFSLLVFVVFSIAAAVCCAVGTVIEGCLFSFLAVGLPTALVAGVQALMQRFLYGAPYLYSARLFSTGPYYQLIAPLGLLQKWNPLLFLYDSFFMYGSATHDNTGMIFSSLDFGSAQWRAPNFLPLLPWLFVGLACMLAGLFVLRRRRAEIAGFRGTCKPLITAAAFSLAFLAASVLAAVTGRLSVPLSLAIGLLAFLIVCELLQLVLLRSRREWRRAHKRTAACLVPACLVTVLVLGGWFGYTTRLPAPEEIEEIAVSTPVTALFPTLGADGILTQNGASTTDGLTWNNEYPLYHGFSSDADKALLRSLHQVIIEHRRSAQKTGRNTPILISYRLKNGKSVQRMYPSILLSDLQQMVQLTQTDLVKNTTMERLRAISDPKGDVQVSCLTPFLVPTGEPYLTGAEMQAFSQGLSEALQQDFEALGADLYTQAGPTLGVLDVTSSVDMINPSKSDRVYHSNVRIILTSEFVNTMQFFEARQSLGYFQSTDMPPPTQAKVIAVESLSNERTGIRKGGYFLYDQFTSLSSWEGGFSNSTSNTLPTDDRYLYQTNEQGQIDALASASSSRDMMWGEGYLVYFVFPDGSRISRYLPKENAPAFLPVEIR